MRRFLLWALVVLLGGLCLALVTYHLGQFQAGLR